MLDSRTREWRRIVLDYGEAPLHLVISPDGTKLAAECLLGTTKLGGSKNSEVRVWDLTNGKQFASFEAQGFPEFVEDGKGLALCHQEGVRFCDPTTGKEYAATKVSPNIYVGNIGFSVPIPRTHLLAVPTSHHSRPSLFSQWCSTYLGIKGLGEERYADELAFLDTRTGDKVAAIVRPRIADVQIFPDGKKLALMTFENNQSIIEIWDIPPRKPLRWILGLLAIPGVVTLFAIRRWRKASKRSSI